GAGLGAAAGGTAGYYIGKHLKCDRERQEELDATKGGTGCGCPRQPVGPVASVDSVPPPPRSAPPPPVARSTNPAEAARIEYEMGRSATSADRALRHYEEAIRLDPSRPEPHNARGMILAWQGRTEEAKRAYAQALALDPGYRPAIDNLQGLAAR
ncbi:MAG TPA: tetratricopeptide repeat protein, partial [Planctomycetota bacterium]|nr:tetratricopeptide repeat protein [Planctomycetota bacterium]